MSKKLVFARAVVITMSVVSAACCSKQQAAAPGAMHGANSAPTTAVPGEILTVEPANRQACDAKGAAVAVVRWKSTHPQVKVMETNPGEPTRLFSGGGYAGQATTGPWVVADTRFALLDATTGTTLATATIDRSPCTR